ncbi:MAG TPA: hypothetical protein PKI72_04730, partial [Giesbergeria sp.]|nr:hypothetical protein [Giesbergeria sp.]
MKYRAFIKIKAQSDILSRLMCPKFPQWFRLFFKKTWFGASLWVVIAVVLWSSEGPSINTGDW